MIYPVLWVQASVLYKTTAQGWLGICGYSKRVFAVKTSHMAVLLMNDVITTNGRCEEGTRCLDYRCPFNEVNLPPQEGVFAETFEELLARFPRGGAVCRK